MAELNKASWDTKYTSNGGSDIFRDSKPIIAADLRTEADDAGDSLLFKVDDLPKIFGLVDASAGIGSNDYTLTFPYTTEDPIEHYIFVAQFNQANTGAVNLVVDVLTLALKKKDANGDVRDLSPGDIKASATYLIAYTGSFYELVTFSEQGDQSSVTSATSITTVILSGQISNNSVNFIQVTGQAVEDDGAAACSFLVRATVKSNNSGTLAIVGTNYTEIVSSGVTTATVTISTNTVQLAFSTGLSAPVKLQYKVAILGKINY